MFFFSYPYLLLAHRTSPDQRGRLYHDPWRPRSGKSAALRRPADRLQRLGAVTVGAIHHPQSNLADFYRQIGDIFGVPLLPHNRWAGFKVLGSRNNHHQTCTSVHQIT